MNKSTAKLTSQYGRKFEFPVDRVSKAVIRSQNKFLFNVTLHFSDLSSITIATHGTTESIAESFRLQSIPVENVLS